MINESFYVDVDINYQKQTVLTGSVPMSVLISSSATSTKEYTSLQQVQSDYTSSSAPELLAATMYFNNGGTDLLIYRQTAGTSDTETISALLSAYNNFIWVSFVAEKTDSEIQAIANALKAANQSLPKYLAITTNIENEPTTLNAANISNVALLYTEQNEQLIPYSAIVIPAYFSGLNLTRADELKSIVFTRVSGVSASEVSELDLTNLVSTNWNVVVNLANRYTILDGGKMVDGQPIHSAWGFAVFKRDCENVITDLLVNKLPYQNSSNVVIENAISKICSNYVTNGLIGTGQTYNLDTQYATYGDNGRQYTLIEKGQALPNGYYIYSIPISNATANDKSAGKIPPVYVFAVIDNVIRLVQIYGEVSE